MGGQEVAQRKAEQEREKEIKIAANKRKMGKAKAVETRKGRGKLNERARERWVCIKKKSPSVRCGNDCCRRKSVWRIKDEVGEGGRRRSEEYRCTCTCT